MPGLFPTLQGFLKKRVPQGQQNQNPGLYQQMPQAPIPRPQAGMVGNEDFNRQQQVMNRGKTRRGMGRM